MTLSKTVLLAGMISMYGLSAMAQSQAVPVNLRAADVLGRLASRNGLSPADVMFGIPLPPGKVVGDGYLSTEWNRGTILLRANDKLLEGYPLRYDIAADELEIKSINGVKVLKGDLVKSFLWLDTLTGKPGYFVRSNVYTADDNIPSTGFLEVLSDGTMPAFKQTTLLIKKADYRPEFNMGSRDDKILKKVQYLYVAESRLQKIPTSKKKLLTLFGDKAAAMSRFMDEQSYTPTSEYQIKAIFDYYNTLPNP